MKNSTSFLVLFFNLLLLSANAAPSMVSPTNTSISTNLLYFSALQKNKEVVLSWKTATEGNSAFFTIEKSSDGVNFQVLATEDGAGTILTEREYFSVDFLPTRGFSYYRLSQTDLDGSKKIFEIQKVEYKIELTIIPNPDEDQYYIYGIPKNTHAQISLTDKDGKEISKLEFKDNGALLVELAYADEAVAFIRIKDDYNEWMEKIVK